MLLPASGRVARRPRSGFRRPVVNCGRVYRRSGGLSTLRTLSFEETDLKQVRPPLPCDPLRLGAPPPRNRSMIAGEQHLWDRAPLPFARPGVMGIFEEPAFEALLRAGGVLAHDAREQSHTGVEHRHGGDLAAREHIVADRDLLERPALDRPLVDALEAAADDEDTRPRRELAPPCLR